ncbi:MAG: hypothetical protein GX061_09230 [Eubacteriaceae bacterium]|nr:hypothetical protein [Eubacteriaceae bacterium]
MIRITSANGEGNYSFAGLSTDTRPSKRVCVVDGRKIRISQGASILLTDTFEVLFAQEDGEDIEWSSGV